MFPYCLQSEIHFRLLDIMHTRSIDQKRQNSLNVSVMSQSKIDEIILLCNKISFHKNNYLNCLFPKLYTVHLSSLKYCLDSKKDRIYHSIFTQRISVSPLPQRVSDWYV